MEPPFVGAMPQPPFPPVQAMDAQEATSTLDAYAGLQSSAVDRKELHISIMCRMGQETVQEIVAKAGEVFGLLKTMQPPNGTPLSLGTQEERKAKLSDHLKHIALCFKKLRRIVDKCNYNTSAMEYTQIEVHSLIPFKDEQDSKLEDKKPNSDVQKLTADNQELIERVMMKNRQLKEIIDKLRSFIWDINTMLAMRKP